MARDRDRTLVYAGAAAAAGLLLVWWLRRRRRAFEVHTDESGTTTVTLDDESGESPKE